MRRVHGKLNIELKGNTKLDGELITACLNVIHKGIVDGLMEVAPTIQKMPEKHRYLTKHFHQFTGNTVASYTAAVVDRGKVKSYFQDDGAPIEHALIQKGESVHLDNPVEGKPRTIQGSEELPGSADYGYIFAENAAEKYAKGIQDAGIVLAPGVGYARGMVDIWANTRAELEQYKNSSQFAWHIKKCIAQAANNYGK